MAVKEHPNLCHTKLKCELLAAENHSHTATPNNVINKSPPIKSDPEEVRANDTYKNQEIHSDFLSPNHFSILQLDTTTLVSPPALPSLVPPPPTAVMMMKIT